MERLNMSLINKKETPKPKTWAKLTKVEKANLLREATATVLKDIERSPHSLIDEVANLLNFDTSKVAK